MKTRGFRRVWAFVLAVLMTVSLVPSMAFAAEETGPEAPAPTETPTEAAAETAAPTDAPAADVPADEEGIAPLAAGQKPSDGSTRSQPFSGGTGSSNYFRIPALVTLDDGTIVAATDARWNTTVDGGGLDTIVSRSNDGGDSWRYTFANYLGDNGNQHNYGSTAFIDPALAVGGDTIYMLVDLFPVGYALNGATSQPPVGETGFTSEGYLRLSNNNRQSYDYYLKDGGIYSNDGVNQGVTVDAYFNYGNSNLFYNGTWKVYPTDYLYLTKSTDAGATWSAPQLINAMEAGEQVYIVGPGRGLVTSKGDIIFPCYEYTKGTQNASFIYSNDDGKTWHRTADALANATRYGQGDKFSGFSSEAQAVEMNNGTIRMFFRHGYSNVHYVDATRNSDGSYTWGQFASGPAMYGNCQLSAIHYSQLIDGKEAVLVSCPTNANGGNNSAGRQAGKIYVGLDNGDGTMDWKYQLSVNNVGDDFAYSCLTELKDGSVALLYENGNGTERFVTYGINEIANGATIGGEPEETKPEETKPEQTEPPVEEDKTVCHPDYGVCVTAPGLTDLAVEECANDHVIDNMQNVVCYDVTPKTASGNYTESATVRFPIPDGWNTANVRGFVVEDNGTATIIEGKVEGSEYVFTAPHFSHLGIMELAAGAPVNVTLEVGQTSNGYTLDGLVGEEGTFTTSDGIAEYTVKHNPGSEGGATYAQATPNCSDLISSNNNSWQKTNYYYQADGSYYPVYAKRSTSGLIGQTKNYTWGYSTDNGANVTQIGTQRENGWASDSVNITVYTQTGTTEPVPASTTITIKGLKPGVTDVTVGEKTYHVTVTAKEVEQKFVDVDLLVGQNKTFTDQTGAYDAVGGDRSIVGVNVTHKQSAATFVEVQEIIPGKKYLIVNGHAGNKAMSQTIAGDANAWQQGLDCDKLIGEFTEDNAAAYLWTFEQNANGKFLIKGADGQYITFTTHENTYQYNVGLTDTGSPMDVVYNEATGCFVIYHADSKYYGGKMYLNDHVGQAVGWYDVSEYWHIYEMRLGETVTTEVTFTGLSVGDTEVKVGNTTYRIHVTDVPSVDNSPIVAGEGQGAGKVVTKLNLTEGVSFYLKPGKGYENSTVTWTSADPAIATVDENGHVTGIAPGETIVTAVVNGMTVEIPVVVHPDGSHTDVGTTGSKAIDIYVSEIVDTDVFYSLTAIPSNSNTMSTEMVPTREGEVFYLNYPSNYKLAFDFFGRPDDGYALTRMSATNAAGHYMALQDETNPKNCDFFNLEGAAGYNQRDTFGGRNSSKNGTGDNQVASVVQAALNKECDGGLGFTRDSSGTGIIKSDLTFRSEKLPEVEKEVYGLLPQGGTADQFKLYEPGMTAEVGDYIYFKVTVTKRDYQDAIDYENMILTDTLADAIFVVGEGVGNPDPDGNQKTLDNTAIGSSSKTDWDTNPGHVAEFYVRYIVKASDLDSTIKNTVELTYNYKSHYSSGSFDGTAEADAQITATDFKPSDYVIDFGLPVEIDFSAELEGKNKNLVDGNGTASYGTVTVSGNKVTYTPGQLLPNEDLVTVKVRKGQSENTFDVSFKVYPASNVLYEAEDFMTQADRSGDYNAWTQAGGNTASQQSAAQDTLYGHDGVYAQDMGLGNNGAWTVDMSGNQKGTEFLTTTFTGNAIDIIGDCSPSTGYVSILVKNKASGELVKVVVVDTYYSQPVIRQVPLAHIVVPTGTYEVTVYGGYRAATAAAAATFGASGTGIDESLYEMFDMLEEQGIYMDDIDFVYFDASSPFAQMNNSAMSTYAATDDAAAAAAEKPAGKDVVIDGFRVYRESNVEAYKAASGEYGATYDRMLDAMNDGFTAYIDNTDGTWTKANYEISGGPQNEVYLNENKGAVVLNTTGLDTVQISARAVTGTATELVVDGKTVAAINSNTEMYYSIDVQNVDSITITAKGGMLALANVKHLGTMRAVTEEQIANAIMMLSAPVEPTEPTDPPVEPTDPPVEPTEPAATEPPVAPTEPEEPDVFEPDTFRAAVTGVNLWKKRVVTVTVKTSLDVDYITVDGKRYEPTNKMLVKLGIQDYYVYTVVATVKKGETADFEIIAYNGDKRASEPLYIED